MFVQFLCLICENIYLSNVRKDPFIYFFFLNLELFSLLI